MLKYNQWIIAREEMNMFKRKIICALLLAALLFTLPLEAFAAQRAVIRLPVKAGLMFAGSEVRLKPRLLRVSAADLTWTSSNPEVVQVQSGRLRGVSAGKAVVTVSGGGRLADTGTTVSGEIQSKQPTEGDQTKLEWQHAKITVLGATPSTRITIRPTNADPSISSSRKQNRWYLDNIRVVGK